MSWTALAAEVTPVGRAPVARANPATKLGVALALSVALLLTPDPVTAAVALAGELAVLPWCGVGPRRLLARSRLLLWTAVPAAVATAVLGVDSGATLVGAGPLTVTAGSATAGLAIGLRILALALPGVVLMATTDPTELADALAQRLRLPERFVLAALAALRLAGVLAEEWRLLGRARRARGLGAGGPLGRLRTGAGQAVALFVLAVRRAGVLATAMEARGFGVAGRRTWARPSPLGRLDAAVLAGGVLLAAGATAAGLLTGSWRLVLG